MNRNSKPHLSWMLTSMMGGSIPAEYWELEFQITPPETVLSPDEKTEPDHDTADNLWLTVALLGVLFAITGMSFLQGITVVAESWTTDRNSPVVQVSDPMQWDF